MQSVYGGYPCAVLVQDSVTRRRLVVDRAFRTMLKCLNSTKPPEGIFLLLSSQGVEFPNYNVNMLIGVCTKYLDEGILAFGFQNPKHDVVIITDWPNHATLFNRTIFKEMKRMNIKVSMDPKYDPGIHNFVGLKRFDRNALDLGNLNRLILEKCFLPHWTKAIGNLPISYLSLSGSTLGNNEYEQDVFWDWMCLDTVGETLKILEMNNCGLKSVPFQVMFLKNLHTLSLAENQLTCIPYFIGELKYLNSLFINNNSLKGLPVCIRDKVLKDLNYFDNKFFEPRDDTDRPVPRDSLRDLRRTEKPPLYSLYYLSLFAMINNGIKIRRDSLPPCLYKQLREYCENLERCQYCKKLLMPTYSYKCIENLCLWTKNLHKNIFLPWNSFECTHKCTIKSELFVI